MKYSSLILFLTFLTFSVDGQQATIKPVNDSPVVKDYFVLIFPTFPSDDSPLLFIQASMPYTTDTGDKTRKIIFIKAEENSNSCLKVHKSYLYSVDVRPFYFPDGASLRLFKDFYKGFTEFESAICSGRGNELRGENDQDCPVGVYGLELENHGLKKLTSPNIPEDCIELHEETDSAVFYKSDV